MCHCLVALLGLLIMSNLDGGALACHAGTPEQCATLPLVPGYQRVGEGYDVVTLQRKGAYVFDVHNYLSPTTNSCWICTNPLMGDQLQKLPYYMVDWRTQNGCSTGIQTSVFASVSSFVESASSVIKNDWGVGLGLGYKEVGHLGMQLAGSKSNVQSFASDSFRSDKSSITLNQFSCNYYRFRVSSRFPLSAEFQRDIQSLPLEYTANTTAPYRHFIDLYGTHFIRLVDLGGRMNKVTTIRTCLATLNSVDAEQVERCMSMGIQVGLGFGPAVDLALNMTSAACTKVINNRDTATHYQKGFLKHMTEVVGGGTDWSGEFSLTAEDSDGFKRWKDSLKSSPDILSFNISPLHVLVADTRIRSNLQTAISEYVIENGIIKKGTKTQTCTPKPNLSRDCCPLLAGRGRLTVFVERGWNIHGDWWGKPEVYVNVIYGGQTRRTHVIRSHGPTWYINYDFGHVETHHRLRVEAWEQDPNSEEKYGEYNDLIRAGRSSYHFGLKSGSLSFSYALTCDSGLSGARCDRYMPGPEQTV